MKSASVSRRQVLGLIATAATGLTLDATIKEAFAAQPAAAPQSPGATPARGGCPIPAHLVCEYLTNPLAIHETTPRLSWRISSTRRGERQSAYRILVASTPEILTASRGDLWDTGKVDSDRCVHVNYGGEALGSRMRCHWKVCIWDADGKQSAWSKPAFWTMGLLQPDDWVAKWIDAAPIANPSEAASTAQIAITSAVYESVIGEGSTDVTSVVSGLVKDNRLLFIVGNDALGHDPAPQHRKQIRVTYTLDGVAKEKSVIEGEYFAIPDNTQTPRPPYLRKSFSVSQAIKRATLYASALGLYRLSMNGERIGDHVLAPDWTDYRKRVRYQAYDVTDLVRRGPNVVGGMVANGWYSGHIGNGGFQAWGKTPALLAQLEIELADGSTQHVLTDESWGLYPGPIVTTDFMLGEAYDAGLDTPGWDHPDFDASAWMAALPRLDVPPVLDPQVMEPVRVTQEIRVLSITEPQPGRWTFDLGQNMVGVIRLKVDGIPAGTEITVHHAEMLNPDGTAYVGNLRGAPSVDTFVADGTKGVKYWQPQFTFHGFRYAEITGLTNRPTADMLTGIVIGSDTPRTGTFSCSDTRLNQLQSNIEWGRRGNYLSVPTDCPQRDERMGWMGDAEVFINTATCNANVAAFFTKWLVDVNDAQNTDGSFSDISPNPYPGAPGAPAWADAGVICPWTIYRVYDDERLLRRHLPAMTRWVEWCRENSTGLIRDKGRGNDYGDWLAIGADTSRELIGTAYFAHSTSLVAQGYDALGDSAASAKYGELFTQIRAAFQAKYITADGHVSGETQCGYLLALNFDLMPENLRQVAAGYLEDNVKAHDWHLTTGFVGVSHLLPALTAAGKSDTAYRLILQDTFPSWLFSVKHGATTIWERWDGWTPDHGFQDPGMNSFNHYSLGSCGQWMFESMAGIQLHPSSPGFRRFVIRPEPGGGLTYAKAKRESMYGEMTAGWSIEEGRLRIDVGVPVNTTATVWVPSTKHVEESGVLADHAPGVRFLRREADATVYEVGSGEYRFTAAWS